jgi:hypothetical protein
MMLSTRPLAHLVILIAVAMGAARICSAQLLYEPSLHKGPDEKVGRVWPTTKPPPLPFFGSNDRSRWATVRALVDDGTYIIGIREKIDEPPGYKDGGIIFEDGWQSLDKVLHPDKQVFLSSKPPLLSTLVAGLYWVLHALFGWTFQTHPFAIVRTILILINLLPFLAYLLVMDRWLERYTPHAWTRLIVLATAAFGTLVTPFLITFNNHTMGTFSVLFALDAVLSIWHAKDSPPWHAFVRAGFFAAFAAANELPALAFAVGVVSWLLIWRPLQTLFLAVPAALVIAAGFLATNYLAIGQFRPAYSEMNSPWYQYEGSYWKKAAEGAPKVGIDWARQHESRGEYALHVLVGHHGLFSLTPIWLLSIAGMFFIKRSAIPWFVPLGTAFLTIVVIAFYLVISDNYGGWSNGLRWLMWLTPLLLLTMLPVVDRLAATGLGRGLVYVLLAVSIFSAHYSLWNPWRHPWIFDLMQAFGWHGYYPGLR